MYCTFDKPEFPDQIQVVTTSVIPSLAFGHSVYLFYGISYIDQDLK